MFASIASTHYAFRSSENSNTQAFEHAWDFLATVVKATTRSAVTLYASNSRSFTCEFLGERERLKALLVLTFTKVFNVTLTLENCCYG